MDQVSEHGTIGLAYVNRKKEREFNKDKYDNASGFVNCCSIDSLRNWTIDQYNCKQRYIHCELAFSLPNDKQNCLAYGVFEDKGVFKQERAFTNKSYEWIFLNCTKHQYASVINFCEDQLGKQYDYSSTSWRLIACPIISDKKKWWCASFVHAALQKAGLLKHYSVNTLDVDDIVDLVSEQKQRIVQGATPYLLQSATMDFGMSMFGESGDSLLKMFGKDGKSIASCK